MDAYNGLMTRIWGPHFWETIHAATFGFPMEPTQENKQQYKRFFIDLGFVLPCKYCRESYQEFINNGDTILNDLVFINRQSITEWAYKLHNKVNEKLGITYNVSYQDVCDRYEAYRAKCDPNLHGCIMPINKKTESYKKSFEKECLIIPIEIAEKFSELALTKYNIKFDLQKYKKMSENINSEDWKQRNKECSDIIHSMRINEQYGFTNGELVKPEMELFGKLCSTLCVDELKNILNKNILSGGSGENKNKIYRLDFNLFK